jgi:hypothetical protein
LVIRKIAKLAARRGRKATGLIGGVKTAGLPVKVAWFFYLFSLGLLRIVVNDFFQKEAEK